MILSRRVQLNGNQLDEISDRIIIQGFDPGKTKQSIQTISRMSGVGQRVTGFHDETIDATLTFAIAVPKRELAERRRIYEAALGWALQKGWLTCNFMEGRRLQVDEVIVPGAGDLWKWNENFTVTFRAYNVPFWQSSEASTLYRQRVGPQWVGQLGVPGMMQTVCDVSFKNTGSAVTIQNFKINCDGNVINLVNLGLAVNETLEFYHPEDGILRIRIGSRSVYGKWSGLTSDDLYINPGSRTIRIETDTVGNVTLAAYGRWPG